MRTRQAHARNDRPLLLALAAAGLVLAFQGAPAGELYRWVDDDGNVHYGDRMPAEATDDEHAVMDDQGVVREERRSAAEEERDRERERTEEAQRRQAESQSRRDHVLLQTFTTEEDLIRTRDRRLEAIDARIGVVEHQMEKLERQRNRHREHLESLRDITTEDAHARELARERIERTESRLETRQATLEDLQQQRRRIADEFDADLERYRELKARRAENE